MSNLRVLVRVRPLLSFESDTSWLVKDHSLSSVQLGNKSMSKGKRLQRSQREDKQIEHQFHFQSVISENITSQQIYKRDIRPTFLDSCSNNTNISIIAYGQTCSGKTHTILGVKIAPGIIPCVLRDLFVLKEQRGKKCSFKASYLQIYNEKITDLLEAKQKSLKIVETQQKGYQVSGCLKQSVNNFENFLQILQKGQKKRQYGHGEFHQGSSRSHTLLNIYVEDWDDNMRAKTFTITIVDLAGSERLTGNQQSTIETGFINKSLFQLTNCISKLAQQAPHIPFRDSKLTKLLQPSLTRSGKSFIIFCVSPSKSSFTETLSTLRLAERAKKIELVQDKQIDNMIEEKYLRARLNDKTRQCYQLKKQLSQLQQKIDYLQKQLQIVKDKMDQQSRLKKRKEKSKKGQSVNESPSRLKINANIVILLDHENFMLFTGNEVKDSQQIKYKTIKQQFLVNMQNIYQQYTKKVLQISLGSDFELRLAEICFMNMVFQHQKISAYKLDVINQLLQSNSQNKKDSAFYQALYQYKDRLASQLASSRSFPFISDVSIRRSSPRKSKNSYSLDLHVEQQNLKINNKQREGNYILSWGCKKDGRLGKGQQFRTNIIKLKQIGKINKIICGYHHTFAITANGQAFGWGKNTQRQISNIQKQHISVPVKLQLANIKSIAAGWGHSMALTNQGKVYAWGYGKDGQLGNGTKNNYSTSILIPFNQEIRSIFAGHSHSGILNKKKQLYMFGFNQDYRLMIGQQREVLSPKKVPIKNIEDVSLGVTHSAIVTSNGSVFAGGTGRSGELGVVLDSSITGWEKLEVVDRKFQQENYEKVIPIVQIQQFGQRNKGKNVKCGENMTIVLTQKGQVYSYGKQISGRLGRTAQQTPKILSQIDLIDCGSRNGYAVSKRRQMLYSWGFNLYNQTSSSISGDLLTPQEFQDVHTSNLVGLSAGFFHTAALFQ